MDSSPSACATAFQSTRPRGRTRLDKLGDKYIDGGFNPRVLAGGRDLHIIINNNVFLVSIHASSREDATNASCDSDIPDCFNPRVLAGGRDQ